MRKRPSCSFQLNLHAVVENPADDAAEDQPGRPARVQDVEVVRAVLREKRRDQRVGDRLERAVGEREDEHAEIQDRVRRRLRLSRRRRRSDQCREHVQHERRDDQLAVADLVHDQPADDDAEAESGETGAADGAELRAGEAELRAPVVKDAPADAETDAGREDCHESGPQQPLGVRGDGVGLCSRIAHGCALSFLSGGPQLYLFPAFGEVLDEEEPAFAGTD